MGFLIPSNFPQNFTVASHVPSSYRGNFLFHFLKTHVAKGSQLPLYPFPPSHRYGLFTEAIFSPPSHMAKASSTACVHLPIPSPSGLRAAHPLLLARLSQLVSSPSSFFFPQSQPLLGCSASSTSYFLPLPLPEQTKMRGSEGVSGKQGPQETRKGSADGGHKAPRVLLSFQRFGARGRKTVRDGTAGGTRIQEAGVSNWASRGGWTARRPRDLLTPGS